jgi:hypothetical protein
MKAPATLKSEDRQKLFYRKYRYAIHLRYQGFEYLDNLDSEYITRQYGYKQGYTWRGLAVPAITLEQLLLVGGQLQQFELDYPDHKKINSWHDRFYYINSDTAIGKLRQISEISVVKYREANVCLPDGVLLRKNNPYQYRTYFRERRIEDPTRGQKFLESINKYGDYFRLNNSTRSRLASARYKYPFSPNSFIEHNGLGDRLMLEMLLPGFFGATLPIQTK